MRARLLSCEVRVAGARVFTALSRRSLRDIGDVRFLLDYALGSIAVLVCGALPAAVGLALRIVGENVLIFPLGIVMADSGQARCS